MRMSSRTTNDGSLRMDTWRGCWPIRSSSLKKQKQCAAFTTNKNLGRVYVFHRFDQSEEQCRDFGVYPSDMSDQLCTYHHFPFSNS